MDDIEIGTNVFIASAWQDCLSTIITNWKAKNECWAFLHTMSTPQLQMLLNKHDNNHCHALQTLVCMVLVFLNKYLLRLSKLTTAQWWKYVSFLWMIQMVKFWKLSSELMIYHKHSNPRFHDKSWAKMIQLSRKHYSHQDVTFHLTPY
jgi:hypothetical protein